MGRAVRDVGRLTTLAHVRPTEVQFVTEGLVHSHDTLKQRVRLGTMEGMGKLERALGREIVGRGRERRFKRQGNVGHLEMGSKICRRVDHWAIVVLVLGEVVLRSIGMEERVVWRVVVLGVGHGGERDDSHDEDGWGC